MTEVELASLLIAWAIAGGSPGPATLTISGTAMARGRVAGVVAGLGILCGSAIWGLASALGMGAAMLAHAWLFTSLKYAGALYLGFLAWKSLRAALSPSPSRDRAPLRGELGAVFAKCVAIHLTNPKAILAWGAIYAIALPSSADANAVFVLYGQLLCVSFVVFVGYGVLFSSALIVEYYKQARRGFEAAFAALFGLASLRILTVQAQ